jgi:hypothetical protein
MRGIISGVVLSGAVLAVVAVLGGAAGADSSGPVLVENAVVSADRDMPSAGWSPSPS